MRIKTTKELSRELRLYLVNTFTGGFTDSKELEDLVKDKVLKDANSPGLAKFVVNLGGGKALSMMARYQEFRDTIQRYQREFNVSSVVCRQVMWQAEIICYFDLDDQLVIMPQDLGILARHRDRTIEKFITFCDRYRLPIFHGNDNGLADTTRPPLSADIVRNELKKFTYCSLSGFGDSTPCYNQKNEVDHYFLDYGILGIDDIDMTSCLIFRAYKKAYSD
jgi:hypothetical protein